MAAETLATVRRTLDAPAGQPAEASLDVTSSFSGRPWRMRPFDEASARALELLGASSSLARILAGRGVVAPGSGAGAGPALETFLAPRLRTLLPDPHVLFGMAGAAERFADAIKRREMIAVLGDYDVDGASSGALLLDYLRALKREALLYVPDRLKEGYGPSVGAVKLLHARGASLLLTVDCGAGSNAALEAARDFGLDVIVLDHHAVETNPPAFAHVNPNGPDDRSGLTQLCAAGLVFLFLVAVQRILREEGWFASEGVDPPDLLDALDLVALATMADVVPLVGVNRAFVRQGLRQLDQLKRPGLAALARIAGVTPPFSPYHLGFVFGPRINAGGRVGRCDLGTRLLACREAAEAEAFAFELDRHNRERQAIEAAILESATAMALAQEDDPFLLVGGEGWHPGVVGIIAGRLKERHAKPVLVAGFDREGEDAIARGSGRSVEGVDLGAIVRAARGEGLLEAGGGHAMAAGFSLRRRRLADFRAFLADRIGPLRATVAAARDLLIDAMVSPSGAVPALVADIERAGPYGAGNPEPVLVLPDLLVAYAGLVGSDHVRLRLVGRDGRGMSAIAFRASETPLGSALLKARGARVHAAGRLKRDSQDGAGVELHLEDAAPAQG